MPINHFQLNFLSSQYTASTINLPKYALIYNIVRSIERKQHKFINYHLYAQTTCSTTTTKYKILFINTKRINVLIIVV